jgi:hypothetical protein
MWLVIRGTYCGVQWRVGPLSCPLPQLFKNPDMASSGEHELACTVVDGPVKPPPALALQESGYGQSSGACFSL